MHPSIRAGSESRRDEYQVDCTVLAAASSGGGRVHLKFSDPARIALAALPVSLLLFTTQAHAQSLTIPLQYYNVNGGSLGITVGINAGAPQPYLFDTGSNLFNVLYNPATWGGGGQTAPNSTVARGQNQYYCYGSEPCY